MISVEVAKLLVSLASPQLNDIDSRRCIGLYDAVPLFGNEDVPCDEMHVRQLIGQIYHILLKLLPSRHLYSFNRCPRIRMNLVHISVVKASCLAENSRLQIYLGYKSSSAAVVHRYGLLGADSLNCKEYLELMCLRILHRYEPYGVHSLVVNFVKVAVLLHSFA